MKKISQIGVGHVVILLVVAIVAVIGFTGYKVVTSQPTAKQSVATEKSAAQAVIVPPKSPELKAADATLTQTDQDLQSSLDTTALDQDIDALL